MYAQVLKNNPYHDEKGLFTDKDGASHFQIRHTGSELRKTHLASGGSAKDAPKGEWVNRDGTALPAHVHESMKRLNQPIPAAWGKITINPTGTKDMVHGVDAKGRDQSIYTTAHHAAQSAEKHERVSRLNPHVSKLDAQAAADMGDKKKSARARDIAATVRLITRTGLRPGSTADTGADNKAYGASTLERRHITVKDSTVSLKFPSKSGQVSEKVLKDPALASYLKERMKSMQPGDKVFKSSGASAGAYLKQHTQKEFLIKDLRTWNGTSVAKDAIKKMKQPTNEAEMKAMQKAVAKLVSDHLQNTPAIALKDYINPKVWPKIKSPKSPRA